MKGNKHTVTAAGTALLAALAQEHPGRHAFITELGTPVMRNNGVEFAVTYFTMLLAFFSRAVAAISVWITGSDAACSAVPQEAP